MSNEMNKESVKKLLKDKDIKDIITNLVKDKLGKDEDFDKLVKEISKDTLTQLFRTMWNKREFWQNNIK